METATRSRESQQTRVLLLHSTFDLAVDRLHAAGYDPGRCRQKSVMVAIHMSAGPPATVFHLANESALVRFRTAITDV